MLAAPLKLPPVHVRHLSPSFQSNGQPKIKFVNPNSGNFDRNIRHAAELPYRMIKHGELHGRDVIIAGSGPSLNNPKVLSDIEQLVQKGVILCALKKAIRVLTDKGFKVEYSVTMDPGAHIACPERLYKAPGTKYILASSSDILLFEYMQTKLPYIQWIGELPVADQKRILGIQYDAHLQSITTEHKREYEAYCKGNDSSTPVIIVDEWLKSQGYALPSFEEWRDEYLNQHKDLHEGLQPQCELFHSACGLPNEVQLYTELFAGKSKIEADAWVAGGGFNVTNRAAAAFLFMGVNRLIFAGADGGWREGQSFYADGKANRPGVDMCDNGRVDGTPWWTRPDMLASSVALARLGKQLGQERMLFLGDVMPATLLHKDDAFLDNCVSFQK